jgi:hypothetical protein
MQLTAKSEQVHIEIPVQRFITNIKFKKIITGQKERPE